MLRDLNQTRPDGSLSTRKGENDPSDSMFVVLLGEEINGARSWNIGSIWCTEGEAVGAKRRYLEEGHKAHHGWDICVVMEYQTGQLAPHSQRHGGEGRPPRPEPPTAQTRLEELELEMARLKVELGQASGSKTVTSNPALTGTTMVP